MPLWVKKKKQADKQTSKQPQKQKNDIVVLGDLVKLIR